MKKLVIYNIEELPAGRGLETPMHPKKMRRCYLSPPPPTTPLVALPSPASSVVPSPANFVKSEGQETIPSSRTVSPMQHQSSSSLPTNRSRKLRNKHIKRGINYGSDTDTDESDDEDHIVITNIPRVFQSALETPLDLDTAVKNEVTDPEHAADTTPADGLATADVSTTTTEQPLGLFDFDWREFPNPPIPPESRRETFSQINVGPTTSFSDP